MFSILGGDGKEYGPVSVAKIQEWITAGRANLETKAKRPNETEWRTLGEFPEFNAAGTLGTLTNAPAAPDAPPVSVPVTPAFTSTPPPAAATPASGLTLAGRWIRLCAVILDSIVGGCFALPGLVVLAMAGVFSAQEGEPLTPLGLAGAFVCVGGLLVLLAIQIYLLVTRGQTIGKLVVGIKIVDYDTGTNPGFVKVFLLRSFVNSLIGAIPLIGNVYSLVDVLFIFREDRRCIHDLIAGTKVVKV